MNDTILIDSFHALTDSSKEPHFLLTKEGVILAANSAATASLRCPEPDLRHTHISALVSDSKETVQGYLHNCARTGSPVPARLTWLTKDGKQIQLRSYGHRLCLKAFPDDAYLLVRAALQENATDKFFSLNRVLHELTASKNKILAKSNLLEKEIVAHRKAAQALEVSSTRLKTILDSLEAIVYVADMQTYELLFLNRFARDLFGNATGKLCWQTIQVGQTGPCPFCTNAKLVNKRGKPTGTCAWEFQNTLTNQWYDCRDQAIVWTDNRLVRVAVATDITQRKLSQLALAEEKERLAVTLRSIGDGVITTDYAGRIVLLNKVAEKLTGWSNDEAAGRPLEEVFHIINEQTHEVCENPVTKVITSGQIVGLANHTALIARDGTIRSIADSGAPILDAQNKIIGVVLVFRDVSEQLAMEKEMFKIKKLESVGVLAGGIAHDFNNILAAILGNISLALFDSELKGGTKTLLSEAEKASLRAKDLTQQLLTFAKGGEPVKEASSLERVIKDSADFVLHGDKVACHYDIPADLWLVDIDKGQISQVIQNIILNARQAMPGGGTIRLTCENFSAAGRRNASGLRGKFVKICLQDTGIGIPANVLDRIFDPYFTTKQQGSGLGLAITQSIVAKHNGHISVASSPGVGTTFTIYLPASEKTATQLEKTAVENKASFGARVLIMDDEEMVRNVTKSMLLALGHEAVPSASGEEALGLYREAMDSGRRFDLVIMDLTIPGGMGGKDAVQETLKIDPEAKVIVSSGYSTDPIMANCREYGFCAAIVKPYQLQELSRLINQIIDGPCPAICGRLSGI